MEPLRITIGGTPPRTKKTSSRVLYVGTRCRGCRRGLLPIVMPSEAYEEFEDKVAPALQRAWAGRELARVECSRCKGKGRKAGKKCCGCLGAGRRAQPIACAVLVEAVWYRQKNLGDLAGFIQALGDVLEAAGIIDNDRLIAGWPMPRDGGLPLRKDAKRPRIELVITAVQPQQPALAGVN